MDMPTGSQALTEVALVPAMGGRLRLRDGGALATEEVPAWLA